MKRIILLVIIIFIVSLLIKIPKYCELNNLIIIDRIKIICNSDMINVSLREVQPIKGDNGITYKYNYYNKKVDNIRELKNTYYNSYHKNFYYDKTKYLITNCSNVNDIKDDLDIRPKKIKKSYN